MTRKREREDNEEQSKTSGDGKQILGDLLIDKVLEKLDVTELANGLAPSLAGRLLWSLNMGVLSERVMETLAGKLANNKILIDEVTTHILKRLKVSPEIPAS